MQNPIILVSEVENGMEKACQLLYHREAADRLFVAEATTCLGVVDRFQFTGDVSLLIKPAQGSTVYMISR